MWVWLGRSGRMLRERTWRLGWSIRRYRVTGVVSGMVLEWGYGMGKGKGHDCLALGALAT